jgi:hypothetical protein
MAYGDESPLVGLNYVRDAAVNLALADPLAAPVSMPLAHAAGAPEKYVAPVKVMPMDMSSHTAMPKETVSMPSLDYPDPKANLSLLQRLAEKFGFER